MKDENTEKLKDIFSTAAEALKIEAEKKRMSLSPLEEMKRKLNEYCSKISKKENLSFEDELLIFHFFFMTGYINHIMNHIAGDASYKLDDDLLKDITKEIARGFETYVRDLNNNRGYEGLVRMPLPYLRKIRYIRGGKDGK